MLVAQQALESAPQPPAPPYFLVSTRAARSWTTKKRRDGGTSSGRHAGKNYDKKVRQRNCEGSRGTVGSAVTRQPAAAARRSQAPRCRARPVHDAGVHLRPEETGN